MACDTGGRRFRQEESYDRLKPALQMLAAVLIFAATYLVMAIGRMPGLRIDRTGAAIIGASLMVATNVLTLDEA